MDSIKTCFFDITELYEFCSGGCLNGEVPYIGIDMVSASNETWQEVPADFSNSLES